MKIAVSGKGGVGKTTISGTLARIFQDRGKHVLAVDSDPSMNLHTSLGLDNPEPISELKELIQDRAVVTEGIFKLNPKVDDVPDAYSTGDENLKLIVMGTVKGGGQGCICPETTFLRALLRHLVLGRDEVVILDTEAGLEHLARGTAEGFDAILIVVEPSGKAVETANRVIELAGEIGIEHAYAVANKVSSPEQEEFIRKALPIEVIATVPYDQSVVEGDIKGEPLYERRDSLALKEIEGIVDFLVGRELK